MGWLRAGVVAAVLLVVVGGRARADSWSECGGGYASPKTCACFTKKQPEYHILGTGPRACDFKNPPETLDFSTASDETMAQWGVLKDWAPALAKPETRVAVFHAFRRWLVGTVCTKGDKGMTCDSGISAECVHPPSDTHALPVPFDSYCAGK